MALRERRAGRTVVRRYGRTARWFHAGVYAAVLVLLFTGWWLIAGNEGRPSPLSRLFGVPDTVLHTYTGWAFAAVVGVGVAALIRGVPGFARETVRVRRTDLTWWRRWPAAVVTGGFARHDGRFDPGQRLMNIGLVVVLALLVASGAAIALLHGGPWFPLLVGVHRWSTYALTALVAGHVTVAAGILPGYRGVWRSMHLGGRLDRSVARRLWPDWREHDR
ncbi:MAG TPA: cytochrome b/b6 domain-containing protein [Streptosporangiaceae bacterium]